MHSIFILPFMLIDASTVHTAGHFMWCHLPHPCMVEYREVLVQWVPKYLDVQTQTGVAGMPSHSIG